MCSSKVYLDQWYSRRTIAAIKHENIHALQDVGITGHGLEFLSNTELRILYESTYKAQTILKRKIYGSTYSES